MALPLRFRVIQLLWAAGFLVGTTTHIADLVTGGPDVYAGYPEGARLFWVALTVLDPLTVVLVLLRKRAGIALGAAVMIADVSVNLTVAATIGGFGAFGLVNQTVFCVFVLATAYPLWRVFAMPR
ncbi:hypothetical protein HD599_000084 [Conyzicola lurida]|uniref:DoxX-like protein n=1 Tax=Conyzicola lurida TaxID=1172621 RepID=A0A841AJ85_9MICO|nr:hypothetical protein [Conyzicola lurida]MBB5841761.1 hypothetical protein [Conyzicola lurida]